MSTADFDDLLKPVRKALRNLPGTADRPIARRNARRRVLAALRSIRTVVDLEYPAIIKRGKVTRLKTKQGQHKRMVAAGWSAINASELSSFLAAGIKPRLVNLRDEGKLTWPTWYVPHWAKTIGAHNPDLLRRAKKSMKHRRAALTAHALTDKENI